MSEETKELKNYIPISRTIFEHHFWREDRAFSRFEAWLYLIQKARFEDTKLYKGYKIVHVMRGQVFDSIRFLAEAWKWDKNKVTRFLNLLERDGMINKNTETGTGQTIITICNYDTYNPILKKSGRKTGHERDTSGTKINNVLNKDKYNTPLPPKMGEFDLSFISTDFFEIVADWLEYKKQRNQKYKSQKSIEAMYKKLLKLSNGSIDIARGIIEQSMANNWSGIFEIKQEAIDQTTNNHVYE